MKTTCLDGLWQEGRDFLGVRYPILCGAMTWISDSTLVKAVSDQGGFGCLAAGNMPGDALAAEIEKCAAQTMLGTGFLGIINTGNKHFRAFYIIHHSFMARSTNRTLGAFYLNAFLVDFNFNTGRNCDWLFTYSRHN